MRTVNRVILGQYTQIVILQSELQQTKQALGMEYMIYTCRDIKHIPNAKNEKFYDEWEREQ